jgi:hypothetical protein
MRDEATTQGASVPDKPAADETVERTPTPRETAVIDIADKFEQQRETDRDELHAVDSEQKQMHDDIVTEQELSAEGATITPMADAQVPGDEKIETPGAQENLQTDPMEEYIVTNDDGVQCFATVIDGQQKLIPLDAARQQLQKRESGEVRLQQAAERGRFLDERELQIQASERALQERFEKTEIETPPPQPDVGDRETLRKGAQDVVTSLFSESEEAAADKLVDFIVDNRTPQASAPAPIDTGKIADDAANAAVEQLDKRVVARDAKTGYEDFQTSYPDIMADPNLYHVADDMTDEISAEHPNWPQSKVMSEAGRLTREWAAKLKGGAEASTTGDLSNTDRQDRKGELVRMPTAAAGATSSIAPDEAERAQTPKEALNDIRKSRGQVQ